LGQEGSTPYASGLATTSFTDNNATSGTTFYYYVVAIGSGGVKSSPSNEASATAR
jgi:hypothetical protein